MTSEPLDLTEGDRRLLVAALLQYRSHLLGYVHSLALENGDQYAADSAILRDRHAERLTDRIRNTGGAVLTDGEE
jgi:hypothetical protein